MVCAALDGILFVFFFNQSPHCSPGWPIAHFSFISHTDSPASASHAPRLYVYAAEPQKLCFSMKMISGHHVHQKDLVARGKLMIEERELSNSYLPLACQNLFMLWPLMFLKISSDFLKIKFSQ